MIFKPVYRYASGCASYLVGCGGKGKCAVVDPHEGTVDEFVEFSETKGMAITHVIDTHIHADHISVGPELARRSGAEYCLHASADFEGDFTGLKDGQFIELGNLRLKVLHTPGHTPESLCLVGVDGTRAAEPWFALTGDTLFVGSVGRPDLPGNAEKSAGDLYESLHGKLLTLPDAVEVYPGHFSGSACGAGMSGKPSSTLAFERRFNRMLSLPKAEFIAALIDVPAKPEGMMNNLRVNRGC